MSENEFDVERDRAEDERDNVVLTGEEIELPGEGSDASAIIGESSEPIHTGEIESVAIGSLKARVPATAPLKPAIEDKISTGELPVVSAAHEAGAASGAEDAPADASSDAPEADGSAQREGEGSESEAATSEAEVASSDEAAAAGDATKETPVEQGTEAPAQEAPSDEPAEASSTEDAAEAESDEPSAPVAEEAPAEEAPAEESAARGEDATDDAPEQADETTADEATDEPAASAPTEEHEPARSPVMTPAQAAAALGLNLDSVREHREEDANEPADAAQDAPTDDVEETPIDNAEEQADEATTAEGAEAPKDNEEPVSAVGGAAAEATHTLASRRSMIFGDEEPVSPSIPALSPAEQQVGASSAQEPAERDTASDEEATKDSVTALVDGPTKQLPTQATSYSFADQDQAEAERPRRRSLLNADDDERDAATLAAIASANRDRSENTKEPAGLDDELFSAAPVVTEMPSRRGAHFLSLVLFLTPLGWYLASDAGARMTLADAAPMYTGVASILALGELLGAIVVAVILFAAVRRSSLGAWIMGVATLIVGLPWVLAPGITASTLLASLNALSASSSLGANLSHHLQASGYSGRFAILGIVLMGVGYLSHSARRTGRAEEALRTSIEAVNPAGAFYSKRARKKAAKDLNSK